MKGIFPVIFYIIKIFLSRLYPQIFQICISNLWSYILLRLDVFTLIVIFRDKNRISRTTFTFTLIYFILKNLCLNHIPNKIQARKNENYIFRKKYLMIILFSLLRNLYLPYEFQKTCQIYIVLKL